jgi:hypothetical protein
VWTSTYVGTILFCDCSATDDRVASYLLLLIPIVRSPEKGPCLSLSAETKTSSRRTTATDAPCRRTSRNGRIHDPPTTQYSHPRIPRILRHGTLYDGGSDDLGGGRCPAAASTARNDGPAPASSARRHRSAPPDHRDIGHAEGAHGRRRPITL